MKNLLFVNIIAGAAPSECKSFLNTHALNEVATLAEGEDLAKVQNTSAEWWKGAIIAGLGLWREEPAPMCPLNDPFGMMTA